MIRTAQFSSFEISTKNAKFSHAWAVFFANDHVSGFAGSRELAEKAANAYASKISVEQKSTRIEIVEVR